MMTFDDARPVACRTVNLLDGSGLPQPVEGPPTASAWDVAATADGAVWSEVPKPRRQEEAVFRASADGTFFDLGPGTTGTALPCGDSVFFVRDPQGPDEPARLMRWTPRPHARGRLRVRVRRQRLPRRTHLRRRRAHPLLLRRGGRRARLGARRLIASEVQQMLDDACQPSLRPLQQLESPALVRFSCASPRLPLGSSSSLAGGDDTGGHAMHRRPSTAGAPWPRYAVLATTISALVAGLLACWARPSRTAALDIRQETHRSAVTPPNIVVVIADDMRADDLRFAPSVRRLVARRGVTVRELVLLLPALLPGARLLLHRRFYPTTTASCGTCARTAIGAFDDSRTLATSLSEAGYRTGFVGQVPQRLRSIRSHGDRQGVVRRTYRLAGRTRCGALDDPGVRSVPRRHRTTTSTPRTT